MGKNTLIAVGSGGLSALASVAPLSGSPLGFLLACVAPLPLFLVGLSHGAVAAWIAGLAAVLTLTVVGGVPQAIAYAGMHALPVWLIIRQVLSQANTPGSSTTTWYPVGYSLCWVTVLAAGGATAAAISLSGPEGIEASVRGVVSSATRGFGTGFGGNRPHRRRRLRRTVLYRYIRKRLDLHDRHKRGLAQVLASRGGRNIRPTPEWSMMVLPSWIAWLLVASAAAALIGTGDVAYMARNLVLIFATPTCFSDLPWCTAWFEAYRRRFLFSAFFM